VTPDDAVSLPSPCLVILVGPSSSGKSTWAAEHFAPEEIVASDRLRAVVGHGEDDLDATTDAFDLLDTIVRGRVKRHLTTVIDTLGFDATRRTGWRDDAAAEGLPVVVVTFPTSEQECRERNRHKDRPLPAPTITRQLRSFREARERVAGEGYALVLDAAPVRVLARHHQATAPLVSGQRERPVGLRFGLHVSSFAWAGGTGAAAAMPAKLRAIASEAERAGFDSVWVMDHLRQIPQVGRDWDPMPEAWSTLSWLAAATERMRLGSLVTPVTFRNIALFGKIVATVDVLSGGRVVCGIGAGWYEREHTAYGLPFPPIDRRYALLEDALEVLPLVWGPGSPRYDGRIARVPEAICYPRPLQEHVPILVGGGGERRTLRLVARHGDACNVFGEADVVRHKVDVLRRHCEEADRDPATIEVTQLSTTLVGRDRAETAKLVERLRPRRLTPDRYAAQVHAGSIDDQIGRFRALADAGVATAIVALPDVDDVDAIERFAGVIDAFA
jgi:F420-dependent oxidoreductase-like protein